ncbi:dynein axonemal assembly factor 3-like [Tubulanus polymorphus]|uniref:dynein axonemal assembly factor 3-like n=1 Tax=Tubulanus polymorphus TaxID=672921 RepID=UPI003DA632DF
MAATDAFGSITWWGFSPALDLLENIQQDKDVINLLVIGAGDLRHVLKTIAHQWRKKTTKTCSRSRIHIYIIENNLELYARAMLFLSIILESPENLGLQEKTELFLELYGNSMVRQQSCDYVQKMSTEFIKWVNDFDLLAQKLPCIDLSQLKYKEVDALEAIFKFWRNRENREFEIDKYWDLRLRQHLGVRYDAIPNVFDWDLSMKLHHKDADIIHTSEYKQWRQTGVAYEIRDGSYNVPNRTLASGVLFKTNDGRVARRGYWGDILVSPFIAWGIESEEKSFFKKSNQLYTKTAGNVAEYNVTSLIYELLNEDKYVLPSTEDGCQTATLEEITEEDEVVITEDKGTKISSENTSIQLPNVKIHFMPLSSGTELHKKNKFRQLFDVVYLSNSMVHLLTPEMKSIFSDKAVLILETAKYMLELKEEQSIEFVKKVRAMAANAGCKVVDSIDEKKDVHIRFKYNL